MTREYCSLPDWLSSTRFKTTETDRRDCTDISDPEELRVPFETLETDEVLLTADRNSDIDCVVSVLLDEPELENERLLMTESRRGRLARVDETELMSSLFRGVTSGNVTGAEPDGLAER